MDGRTNRLIETANSKIKNSSSQSTAHKFTATHTSVRAPTMSSSGSCSINDDGTKEALIKRDDAEMTAAAAAAVDAAASRAIELVRSFADQDPSDGKTSNPWKNPTDIYQQLDKARDNVLQAWEELHIMQQQKNTAEGARHTTAESSTEAAAASNEDEDDLRAQFMDMVTDAFADVLNQMKESEEEIDVDVLVDCLQSGIDLMSVQDRELFFQDNTVNAAVEEEDGTNSNAKMMEESSPASTTLTPHEKRRRELGFHVETTA